jgi:hypothetical protein
MVVNLCHGLLQACNYLLIAGHMSTARAGETKGSLSPDTSRKLPDRIVRVSRRLV